MMLSELMPDARLNEDVSIAGLADDSRDVAAGYAFFACPGWRNDGRRFAGDAVARGAVAVICEKPAPPDLGVAVVEIENLRPALGEIASRYYGHPGRQMKTVAVTGTNGKTSVTHFLAQALGALGVKCGIAGTLGYGEPEDLQEPGLTTPPAIRLQSILRRLVDAGCEAVALEASSHGLDQDRLNGADIDVAVLTNLTHDHLDYHESASAYEAAKAKLFNFASLSARVVNLDDDFGCRLRAQRRDAVTYSIGKEADISVCDVNYLESGLKARVSVNGGQIEIDAPVFGECNLQNILAVSGALLALGYGAAEIERGIGAITAVKGRMDKVALPSGKPQVYIDYAHTPDALEKCLQAVAQHFPAKRVTVVFGCGGDRDAAKRPVMGSIAARLANRVVVTSDNPRDEQPERIINEILGGVPNDAIDACLAEPDREAAIGKAISASGEDDVVVIAGKGHEDYQLIGGERLSFSDHETVARVAGQWGRHGRAV